MVTKLWNVTVRIAYAAVLMCSIWATSATAQDWESDGRTYAEMLRQARSLDWGAARSTASRLSDPVSLEAANKVLDWMLLREGREDWTEYTRFLARHSDWPGLKILRLSGEEAITSGDDPNGIVDYFSVQKPQSGHGALMLAGALARLGRQAEAESAIVNGWLSLPFKAEVQEEALAGYGALLKPYHAERLDNLLWQGRFSEARSMFRFLGQDRVALAQARESLREQEPGVDARVAAVPDHLIGDPGLAFERFVWRLKNDAEDRAIELILDRSRTADSLGKPSLWASRRHRTAHSLMLKGQYALAYRVASSHHILPSEDGPEWLSDSHDSRAVRATRVGYSQLEWLSGYLALRMLADPAAAVTHFARFGSHVESPISKAKAEFWLGMAYDGAGQVEQSRQALNRAAGYQTTFYGQIAAQFIGASTDPGLIGPDHTPANISRFESLPVVRAGLLAHHAGEDSTAAWFLAHWAEELNAADVSALAALAGKHGAEFSAIKVAKEGVKNGFTDINFLFPLNGIEMYELPIPGELAISVARQETEFRDRAVSSAGAVGVMQIKPSTGQEVADRIGISGNIKTLLRNRETNVLMGAAYLRERLEEFSGSYILAIASYNAGPRRVAEWLAEIGDPRNPGVDPIDWIEHIPYGETRNYVMRVLEAVTVYRMRIARSTEKIDLISYLESG